MIGTFFENCIPIKTQIWLYVRHTGKEDDSLLEKLPTLKFISYLTTAIDSEQEELDCLYTLLAIDLKESHGNHFATIHCLREGHG